MITIICSTNRPGSVSRKICEQYRQLLCERNVDSQIIDLHDLPHDFVVSALYQNAGKNEQFNYFRKIMKSSTKYVFVIPEYNGSFPGVLKAFIDGMEYPFTFTNKKCALVGLSSGNQGGGLALSHLTDIFNYCGMNVLAYKPKLAYIEKHLNDEQLIASEKYVDYLKRQIDLLLPF